MKKPKGNGARRQVFKIIKEGPENLHFEVDRSFGCFIKEATHADNYKDLNKIIGVSGLRFKAVKPLMTFLDLNTKEIAELTGVSARTVSRWDEESTIGVLPSKNLVKVDSLVHKGIEIFGSEELFKAWLQQPNTALGDISPLNLLSTPYGAELIEDALEALEYGNVM